MVIRDILCEKHKVITESSNAETKKDSEADQDCKVDSRRWDGGICGGSKNYISKLANIYNNCILSIISCGTLLLNSCKKALFHR